MTAADDLPSPAHRLPASTVARFFGDLHLGDGGRNDAFGRKDRLLVDQLADCARTCDAVVFMGDALDVPQGFTVRRILRAHPSVARALTELAAQVPVFFVRGNHDWTVDYDSLFPGARACEALRIGDTLVWHGHHLDRYCHPGATSHAVQMFLHHLFERTLGFQFRVPLHDFDTWQNRIGHWLGAAFARHLRRMTALYTQLGVPARAESGEAFIRYWSRAVWGDPHALFAPTATLLREGPYRAVVAGHTHLPGVIDLDGPAPSETPGATYVNAGSWTFDAAQTATWDGRRFTVHDYLAPTPAPGVGPPVDGSGGLQTPPNHATPCIPTRLARLCGP